MSISSTDKLGEVLGAFTIRQEATKANLAPDDSSSFLQTYSLSAGQLSLTPTHTLRKWEYEPTAFILDHSVQGELDGPYEIDSGYTASSPTTITVVNG